MYHPRIVHLCNVKEVAPSKRLNSKALIYLFYLFLSWFHNNILQRSKHKFDLSTIRNLFLRGLTDDTRNNLNLLGQGDIAQKSFGQICDLCRKFSRNQYRSGKGILNRNKKTKSIDAMILGLENKMENVKIEIMSTINKQINSLKFQQKLVEEQECPKCRRKHLLRKYPLDIKETNKYAICAENHATEKCPSIPRLKSIIEGGQPEVESLHAMGT